MYKYVDLDFVFIFLYPFILESHYSCLVDAEKYKLTGLTGLP